jgi:serine/threonine-protein kinase
MPDPITRLNAALEGRYKIERELGEGGMATVYLADDLRHERKVALKVLKPELAAVVGAERFLTEIKTTANLQHPHILPLFDSGEADSFLFYVMPYVEGETLQERIDREKQLPVDEAVRITTAVAHALQTAHERGIVHRDIKPANILLSRGEPLVADFGIAIAVGAAGGSRLTETGLSVGTPFYMSPEQATGDQIVGPASDTYALACVLYEMLVGEPPYIGNTAQAVLGKIIQGAPVSATAIRKSISANVDAAIRKALEKIPADRFTGAQAFADALADPAFRHGELVGARAGAASQWNRVTVGTAVLAAGLAALATWVALRPEPAAVTRFALEMPEGHNRPTGQPDLAISPDGAQVVYVGPADDGLNQLWLRRTDQLDAVPIPGTEGAYTPAFSPDGDRVAFTTFPFDGLHVASLTGEPPLTLAPTGYQFDGLAWGPDEQLYVDTNRGLARLPAVGGELTPFTVLDTATAETSHTSPQVLPKGRGILFTVWRTPLQDRSQHDIAFADMETGTHRVLLRGVFARYVDPGYLVYVSADGTLLAAPFDEDAGEITGPSVALAEGVGIAGLSAVSLAISNEGSLVYFKGGVSGAGSESELVWVTRSGQASPVDPGWTLNLGTSGNGVGWSLSPDGTRIALTEETDAGRDIWIKQTPDGPRTRLTFFDGDDRAPRWAPDGERVTFVSDRETDLEVWSQRWDGTGEAELVFDYEGRIPEGFWSPDGEWFVFRTAGLDTEGLQGSRDIGAIRPGIDSVPQALIATQYIEQGASLSPDGRWLAYSSNETGRHEVFVRPFPDVEAGKWPVSRQGGMRPRWANNGRELFFVGGNPGDWSMMVAQVETSGDFRVGELEHLFEIGQEYRVTDVGDFYDVDPEGDRFLMGRLYLGDEVALASSLILVQNFIEELKARVPR